MTRRAKTAVAIERSGQQNALGNKSGEGTTSTFLRVIDGRAQFERPDGSKFMLGVCRAVRRGLIKFDPTTGFYFAVE